MDYLVLSVEGVEIWTSVGSQEDDDIRLKEEKKTCRMVSIVSSLGGAWIVRELGVGSRSGELWY